MKKKEKKKKKKVFCEHRAFEDCRGDSLAQAEIHRTTHCCAEVCGRTIIPLQYKVSARAQTLRMLCFFHGVCALQFVCCVHSSVLVSFKGVRTFRCGGRSFHVCLLSTFFSFTLTLIFFPLAIIFQCFLRFAMLTELY